MGFASYRPANSDKFKNLKEGKKWLTADSASRFQIDDILVLGAGYKWWVSRFLEANGWRRERITGDHTCTE